MLGHFVSLLITGGASLTLIASSVCLQAEAAAPEAFAFINVPNADRLVVDGHLWYDVSSTMPRPRETNPNQGSATMNAFGAAYALTPEWATLCPLDSDGDGFTNGEELGDPNCVWTVGATPSRTTQLSHPGLYSSAPVEAYPLRARTVKACARDVDGATATDNRVALRSSTFAAPATMARLTQLSQVAEYRKPSPDTSFNTESRTAASCPHLQQGLVDWHDAATWGGGGVPLYNTKVTIPANTKVLVSSCSLDPRGYLDITVPIGSQLIFADAPIFLRTKDLIVYGDLRLGSATCPLHSPVTITFTGEKTETAYTNGAQAMGTGSVRIHGTRNTVTWTRLAATVLPATAHVLLQDAVGWGPGDQIVVATSIYKDLMLDQNEVRTVVAVSADGLTLVVDKPFTYKHWASLEYQTEVGLLTRSVVLRGGATATAHAAAYGGHIMAVGPNATMEIVGARAHRMGQRNILGRYPFHLHLVINGSRSTLQQSSCDSTYYRCISIHKTNSTLVRKNVAYNVTANCYYLEDGSEMFNRIEYNLAVRVHPLGKPAAGAAQGGETFYEDADVAIQPADHAAAGFYISNPHNIVVGNAASGGWSGFAFPIFPYAQRLSADLVMNPSAYPILEFDGNTAHSAGHYWGDAGCIYFGGKLTEVNGKFVYTNGRFTHPTKGIHYVTNLRTWLCNRGLSSWGERVEMSKYEAHDVRRSAVLFGQSAITNMIVTGATMNMPPDMVSEGRQGFGFYDTWVQTSITNTTFMNYWDRRLSIWDRDAVFVDLDHSDIYKPWYISATRALKMRNVDNGIRVGRWVRETGASRMFNVVDWDGSLVGLDQCNATIIGSEMDWWNVGDDCWWNANWPAWLCPRKPGREVVGIDMDLPGIIGDDLDIQADTTTNQLTQAQRDQLYIGHISQFGSKSDRKLIVTRNHHVATGLSGIGWYLYLTTGVPEVIKVWPQNFATTGTSILLAISYPSGTTFDLWAVPRWNAYKTRFVKVGSRQAVADGNGTMYHFDGRHLYLKVSDMWSPYPNVYSRKNVSIPNVMSTAVDFVITATCTSKNAAGFCTTPAAADPPADLDLKIRVCNDRSEQINSVRSTDLCPDLTDVLPPVSYDSGVTAFADCMAYTDKWSVWRCSADMKAKGYCLASCNNSCRVYNPYPHRCSFMDACIKSEFEAPRPDACGELNNKLLSDECAMKTCSTTNHGNYGQEILATGSPCNYNNAAGEGVCNAVGKCVQRFVPSSALPIAARLTDRPQFRSASALNVVEISVTRPDVVTAVSVALFGTPIATTAQWSSATRQSAQSTATTAVYRYTAAAGTVIRGTVRVNVSTSLPAPNNTLSFRFLDWNAVANVVPSFGVPTYDAATGAFAVTVDPIDFVTSARLVLGNASSSSASIPLVADYGVASSVGVASGVSSPTATAVIELTLGTTGMIVKRSVPCLTAAMIGAACSTPVHTVRSTTQCTVGFYTDSHSAWYFQVYPTPGTTNAQVTAMRAYSPAGAAYSLTLQSYGAWSTGLWGSDTAGTLRVDLAAGGSEYFTIKRYSQDTVGEGLACINGTAVPAPDERGTAGVCTAVGMCVVGGSVPTTSVTTATRTTTTATTTQASTTTPTSTTPKTSTSTVVPSESSATTTRATLTPTPTMANVTTAPATTAPEISASTTTTNSPTSAAVTTTATTASSDAPTTSASAVSTFASTTSSTSAPTNTEDHPSTTASSSSTVPISATTTPAITTTTTPAAVITSSSATTVSSSAATSASGTTTAVTATSLIPSSTSPSAVPTTTATVPAPTDIPLTKAAIVKLTAASSAASSANSSSANAAFVAKFTAYYQLTAAGKAARVAWVRAATANDKARLRAQQAAGLQPTEVPSSTESSSSSGQRRLLFSQQSEDADDVHEVFGFGGADGLVALDDFLARAAAAGGASNNTNASSAKASLDTDFGVAFGAAAAVDDSTPVATSSTRAIPSDGDEDPETNNVVRLVVTICVSLLVVGLVVLVLVFLTYRYCKNRNGGGGGSEKAGNFYQNHGDGSDGITGDGGEFSEYFIRNTNTNRGGGGGGANHKPVAAIEMDAVTQFQQVQARGRYTSIMGDHNSAGRGGVVGGTNTNYHKEANATATRNYNNGLSVSHGVPFQEIDESGI